MNDSTKENCINSQHCEIVSQKDFVFDQSIAAKEKASICRKWLYTLEKKNMEYLLNTTFSTSRWKGLVTLIIHSFQPDEEMFYVNEFSILHTWKLLGTLPVVIITDRETMQMSNFRRRFSNDVSIRISPDLKCGDVLSLSRDCLNNLYKYFDTQYCLIIQDDGFPIQDNLDDFLGKWDYIGAPFVRDLPRQYVADILLKNCMNGGFSLRSRQYCVAVSREWNRWGRIAQKWFHWYAEEDWFFSVYSRINPLHRLKYNIPWAAQARKFSAMDILGIVDLRLYRHIPFGIHSPTTCLFYRNELSRLGYEIPPIIL